MVQIRSEEDDEILKNFTQEQKEIRWKYRNKVAKKISKDEYQEIIKNLQNAFRSMAGGEI